MQVYVDAAHGLLKSTVGVADYLLEYNLLYKPTMFMFADFINTYYRMD